MVGLAFTYNDGEIDYFDPVDLDYGLHQNDFEYIVNGVYIIDKEKVNSLRIYDLCDECGYEVSNIGKNCSKWGCINNLDKDNQECFKVEFRNKKISKLL